MKDKGTQLPLADKQITHEHPGCLSGKWQHFLFEEEKLQQQPTGLRAPDPPAESAGQGAAGT